MENNENFLKNRELLNSLGFNNKSSGLKSMQNFPQNKTNSISNFNSNQTKNIDLGLNSKKNTKNPFDLNFSDGEEEISEKSNSNSKYEEDEDDYYHEEDEDYSYSDEEVDEINEENESNSKQEIDNEYLKFEGKLINDSQENRLKEIMGYLKVQKQPFDEGDLSRIFDRLDKDGNKKISSEELKKFLFSLRTPINDFYIDKIVKEFDVNNDGDIDKNEFFKKMNLQVDKVNENDYSELWEIFKLFDANNDDFICKEDLMNVFMALGESVSNERCREMIGYLSMMKEGIDFPTFFELVKEEGKR